MTTLDRHTHRTATPATWRSPLVRASSRSTSSEGGPMHKVTHVPGGFLAAMLIAAVGLAGLTFGGADQARADAVNDGAIQIQALPGGAPIQANPSGPGLGVPKPIGMQGASAVPNGTLSA